MSEDLQFVKGIIPDHYRVEPSKEKEGSLHCVSTGTNKGMDDTEWRRFVPLCQNEFGERLQEFYHHVNSDHQDFTIFLKNNHE